MTRREWIIWLAYTNRVISWNEYTDRMQVENERREGLRD